METTTKAITFSRLPILGEEKVQYEEWKFAFENWCRKYKIENEEKNEYLIAVTTDKARTIVINSLNKAQADSYEIILENLKKRFKPCTPKNVKFLEISTLTIKKGEKVSDFDTKFLQLLNQLQLDGKDYISTPYYINAFRNWSKMYEYLLESEPTKLSDAMEITSKKEKMLKLLEDNKPKSKTQFSNVKKNLNNTNNNNNKNTNFRSFNTDYYNKIPFISNTRTNENSSYNNKFRNNNYNNNFTTNRNFYNPVEFNKGVEQRRATLKGSQFTDKELDDITKKLSDLKINLCINCQRIGHIVEECPELNHLN